MLIWVHERVLQCWTDSTKESCNVELISQKSHAMMNWLHERITQWWIDFTKESCNVELISQKSHAMLNWVHFCGVMSDDATEGAATQSSSLQPSNNCMRQLQPLCLAALVSKFTTLKSWIKAHISRDTSIEPHDLVTQTRTHALQGKPYVWFHQLQ